MTKHLSGLRAAFLPWVAVFAAVASLVACGGGGDSTPAHALAIDPPAALSTSADSMLLTGTTFLPPGSTCTSGNCSGLLPPPVFGTLGPHVLAWSNAATGAGGAIVARWQCNCGGSAPFWMQTIPLAMGDNRITVTMTAGGLSETAAITLTRR